MNKDYRISNIYYMLAYAFKLDKLIEKKDFFGNIEDFSNIYDLLSSMLIFLINRLIKKGFYKDYKLTDELTAITRGKIKITESIKKRTFINKKIVCEYDEYSENVILNKIIKTTLFYLIKSEKMKNKNKKEIKKIYLHLNNIDILEINKIYWNNIYLNKTNKDYRVIINICYLILESLIITQKDGSIKYREFIDEEKISTIYERFVREYYKKHYPQLNPSIKIINWNIDSNYPLIEFLPKMITDINLYYKKRILIIDTKFYASILKKGRFDKKTINRDNWNQLYVYVANESWKKDNDVRGMLLYAQTDEELAKNYTTSIMNHIMSIKILDLKQSFENIKKELNSIADDFMSDENS